MKPITIAEKWTAAALAMWDGTRVSDPLVATLVIRVHAHYGDHTAALSEIIAVAMLEAMNEWQTRTERLNASESTHRACEGTLP